MGGHVLEVAFRHVAAARVLIDEDESVVAEPRRWTKPCRILVDAVRCDSIRGARHHEWIRSRRVARRVDGGEEASAVSHRDANFGLRVPLANSGDAGRVDATASTAAR